MRRFDARVMIGAAWVCAGLAGCSDDTIPASDAVSDTDTMVNPDRPDPLNVTCTTGPRTLSTCAAGVTASLESRGGMHVPLPTPIAYEDSPPSSGNHRAFWGKWGEYDFLGPQVWLHNLEHGAMAGAPSRAEPRPQMALTFDDLPAAGDAHPTLTRAEIAQRIIGVLAGHRVGRVHGFVNGVLAAHMQERLDILTAWKTAGHMVGNHTFGHEDLHRVSAEEFIAAIERNESTLIDFAHSISELKWLRYPFLNEGESNDKRYAVRSYLARRGYRVAPVSVDLDDWAWNATFLRCVARHDEGATAALESAFIEHARARFAYADDLARFIYGREKRFKHVLLLHANAFTAHMLERLLTMFEVERGLEWIDLPEALTEPAYAEDTVYTGPVGLTFLAQALVGRGLTFGGRSRPEAPIARLDSLCM